MAYDGEKPDYDSRCVKNHPKTGLKIPNVLWLTCE